MTEKSYAKYPHIILKRIKNFAKVGNENGDEIPTEFILRADGTHGQESAVMNYVKDGCVIVGHKNLHPQKHAGVIALIDNLSMSKIDPRLLEDKPESVLEKKVRNERSRQAEQ